MHIEFLVEEPSIEVMLNNLLPRFLLPDTSFAIRVFQGKQDLLRNLPVRLRGYKKWLPVDHKIVVLVDKDNDDCYRLKRKLDEIARDAQLVTKSSVGRFEFFQVMNRIVIVELESWFFGDRHAIKTAYPAISPNFVNRPREINPDEYPNPSKSWRWYYRERNIIRLGCQKSRCHRISLFIWSRIEILPPVFRYFVPG